MYGSPLTPSTTNTPKQELYRLTYIPEGKTIGGQTVEDAVLLLEFVGLVDEGHVTKARSVGLLVGLGLGGGREEGGGGRHLCGVASGSRVLNFVSTTTTTI